MSEHATRPRGTATDQAIAEGSGKSSSWELGCARGSCNWDLSQSASIADVDIN
jgi:hypothetical protein